MSSWNRTRGNVKPCSLTTKCSQSLYSNTNRIRTTTSTPAITSGCVYRAYYWPPPPPLPPTAFSARQQDVRRRRQSFLDNVVVSIYDRRPTRGLSRAKPSKPELLFQTCASGPRAAVREQHRLPRASVLASERLIGGAVVLLARKCLSE